MSAVRVVVVGDVMLDRDVAGRATRLSPDVPVPVVDVDRVCSGPGGAGLAALLCADGLGDAESAGAPDVEVTLLAPVRDDPAGDELVLGLTAVGGVALERLDHAGPTRTKTRVRASGHAIVRVDDGGPATPIAVSPEHVSRVLSSADVVLVADYGAGTTRDPVVRAALARFAEIGPVVWDPHPRGGDPVAGCALVTPNAAEASLALADTHDADATPAIAAARLRARWDARAVAVTAGHDGAWLSAREPDGAWNADDLEDAARSPAASRADPHPDAPIGEPVHVPTTIVDGGDPCGAGDRFASAAAVALARGFDPLDAVAAAVASASRWVADGGAAGWRERARGRGVVAAAGERPAVPQADAAIETASPSPGEHAAAAPSAADVAARVRMAGGTLVATGGCFDLVHAGHVSLLERARALGDALVVLLNDDDSVTRLKGAGRPVNAQADRVRVLAALRCVDAVAVFVDDDPSAALRELRPDVWVKGGDYTPDELPEAAVVRSWGGRVETLPLLEGRSTTGILRRGSS